MNSNPSRKLVISADDFGMSDAIDAGILDLIARRRVSATSCLVNSPRWSAAAERLRIVPASEAAIGLHLDLTEFGPGARPLEQVARAGVLRRLDREELRERIDTQCARFEDALDRGPDYVDGHQHVHQLPRVREVLMDVLEKRGHAPWIRVSAPPICAAAGETLKCIAIRSLGAAGLARAALKHGLASTDRLLGVYAFNADDARYFTLLEHWLSRCGENSALMCHPAIRLDGNDPLGHARNTEYCVLAGAAFSQLLRSKRIELVTRPQSPAKSS